MFSGGGRPSSAVPWGSANGVIGKVGVTAVRIGLLCTVHLPVCAVNPPAFLLGVFTRDVCPSLRRLRKVAKKSRWNRGDVRSIFARKAGLQQPVEP